MPTAPVTTAAKDLFAAVTLPGAGEAYGRDGWLEVLADAQAAMNVLAAVQAVAIAQAAAHDSDDQFGFGPVTHRGLGHLAMDAPDLVADRVGCSSQAAAGRVQVAVDQVTTMPSLVEAMATGDLDGFRAAVVADELSDAPADVRAQVVESLAEGGRLTAETAGPLRRRARKVLGAIAPDVLEARIADAKERRGLHRSTEAGGVDHWEAWLPVETARPAWAAVTDRAQALLRDGRATTLAQARADALCDLLLGHATGTYAFHVTLPAGTVATTGATDPGRLDAGALSTTVAHPDTCATAPARPAGDSDGLVAVTGLGTPGQTLVSRAWLDGLSGAPTRRRRTTTKGGRVRTRRVETLTVHDQTGAITGRVTDPDGRAADRSTDRTPDQFTHRDGGDRDADRGADPSTDRTLQQVTHRDGDPANAGVAFGLEADTEAGAGPEADCYRPSAELDRLVRARDGGCRFPGCTISVRYVDLDHVIPYASGGRTALHNLACLCRRHHRIKQRPGWSVALHRDGTMTWTDPTGRARTTWPQDHRPPKQPSDARRNARPHDSPHARPDARPAPPEPTAFERHPDLPTGPPAPRVHPDDLQPFSVLEDTLLVGLRDQTGDPHRATVHNHAPRTSVHCRHRHDDIRPGRDIDVVHDPTIGGRPIELHPDWLTEITAARDAATAPPF